MILFLNMPFGSLTHPNLPLGIFQSQLTESGIDSDVLNLNLDFAQAIGYSGYESVAFFKGVETQVGEWLFAEHAWRRSFGMPEDEFLRLCGEELDNIPKIPDKVAWLRQVRNEVVPLFLDRCVDAIAARNPDVVGFSCTFFQTVSSLALGRLLKERHPEIPLVYGGACFHGEMGDELMRAAPWIDAVSTGEADDVIVPLVEALSTGNPPSGLQGVLYRDQQGTVRSDVAHVPVDHEVIQSLPDPNFDNFFRDAARVGLADDHGWQMRLLAPFESSRGCWWGQKHHCTFCGLNGQGMVYRGKSGEDVEAMLRRMTERYPQFQRFQASDNIMSVTYFNSLIPSLADRPLPGNAELFYSVKSNMTRAQIKSLADAGIMYLQPGIESFSTHILELMDKGVSALQNLFFLKCCREYGILPYWNNLIRLPGETQADYDQMAAWIPKLLHLRPPYGGAPKVECHRFSPYFDQQARWTEGRRPQAWYRGLFPEDTVNLDRVAYYFDADWKDVLEGTAYDEVLELTAQWTRIWKEEPELPILQFETPGSAGASTEIAAEGVEVIDTRLGSPGRWQLDRVEAAVLRAIDYPATIRTAAKFAGQELGVAPSTAAVSKILDSFVDAGLALTENDKYLGIVLQPETIDPSLTERRGFLKQTINNQQPVAAS